MAHLHMPRSNGSLIIAIKLKNDNFCMVVISFHTYKSCMFFQELLYHMIVFLSGLVVTYVTVDPMFKGRWNLKSAGGPTSYIYGI
jgi:hypothetical protein